MKVLILRTFAHTQIWEGISPECEFTNTAFRNKDMILELEPNITQYNSNSYAYAIGIYTHMYFTYVQQPSGMAAYHGTPQENTISLLRLSNYPDTASFARIADNALKINFSFVNKIGNTRDQMLLFDNEMIKQKEKECGKPAISHSVYSLCFSLDENTVNEKLKEILDFQI